MISGTKLDKHPSFVWSWILRYSWNYLNNFLFTLTQTLSWDLKYLKNVYSLVPYSLVPLGCGTTKAMSHRLFTVFRADLMLFSFLLKWDTGIVGIWHAYLIKIPNTQEVRNAHCYLQFTQYLKHWWFSFSWHYL